MKEKWKRREKEAIKEKKRKTLASCFPEPRLPLWGSLFNCWHFKVLLTSRPSMLVTNAPTPDPVSRHCLHQSTSAGRGRRGLPPTLHARSKKKVRLKVQPRPQNSLRTKILENLWEQIFLEVIPEVQSTKNKPINQNWNREKEQWRQRKTLLWFECYLLQTDEI